MLAKQTHQSSVSMSCMVTLHSAKGACSCFHPGAAAIISCNIVPVTKRGAHIQHGHTAYNVGSMLTVLRFIIIPKCTEPTTVEALNAFKQCGEVGKRKRQLSLLMPRGHITEQHHCEIISSRQEFPRKPLTFDCF